VLNIGRRNVVWSLRPMIREQKKIS